MAKHVKNPKFETELADPEYVVNQGDTSDIHVLDDTGQGLLNINGTRVELTCGDQGMTATRATRTTNIKGDNYVNITSNNLRWNGKTLATLDDISGGGGSENYVINGSNPRTVNIQAEGNINLTPSESGKATYKENEIATTNQVEAVSNNLSNYLKFGSNYIDDPDRPTQYRHLRLSDISTGNNLLFITSTQSTISTVDAVVDCRFNNRMSVIQIGTYNNLYVPKNGVEVHVNTPADSFFYNQSPVLSAKILTDYDTRKYGNIHFNSGSSYNILSYDTNTNNVRLGSPNTITGMYGYGGSVVCDDSTLNITFPALLRLIPVYSDAIARYERYNSTGNQEIAIRQDVINAQSTLLDIAENMVEVLELLTDTKTTESSASNNTLKGKLTAIKDKIKAGLEEIKSIEIKEEEK